MKVFLILAAFVFTGCTAQPSLEQLERHALVTGDWSAVESRERSVQRRNLRAGIQCPNGLVNYCETFMTTKRCSCINRRAFNSLMVRF
jgi:hypothetical protein